MHVSVSIQKVFGSYIAELREKSGLKTDQLAEKSGLSANRLNAIERGEVNLTLETLLILAMALDTNPQELFRGIAGRINGGSRSLGGSALGELSPAQIKPKQLWIGNVDVRPFRDCKLFDYSHGAFTNAVTWANDGDEYGRRVTEFLALWRLFVVSIKVVEPVETRRNREGDLGGIDRTDCYRG